ncbi:MAG TPA: RNB domain-containing ribonuclease [Pyrinomonadaceae bacterium]|nr:RNB domain-containing ribonuclease [Pyrinomonadaceae bacterium]
MNDKTSNWLDDRARQTMADNGFEPNFPPEALAELDAIEKSYVAPTASDEITDMRELLWSSIDNESSRDLDQIEYAEQLENGDIRILVGIADVDDLIKKDSALDRHAAKNTVTIYTETEMFPMLPQELSTGLTSLNEGEDRMAVIVELVIKENGDVPGNNVFRAIVRNRAKLAYESIGEWLDNNTAVPEKIASTPGLKEQILLQKTAAQRLHKFRLEKGALEFESIEPSAVMENGEVQGIVSVKENSARRLIENFMVAANVEMAEFLEQKGFPALRRVVKTPEHWQGIREIAEKLGENLPEQPDARALAEFLVQQRAKDPLHFPDLSLSIIKLIGSGEYVVQRPGEGGEGHFGLGVRDYAHSTAPNRRYSDIVVQRLVKAAIAGEPPPYSDEELDAIADHCNQQERAARKVERKMRKVVAATVMKRHVGESFDAIVTGVTDHGTFARILRPPVDGRIVRGEHGLKIGEKVDVRLLSADPSSGFIDFAAKH